MRGQSASVLDDPVVVRHAQRGLDSLYNLNFAAAERAFGRVERRYPEHPIAPFLKALNVWWRILVDLEDRSHDAAFFAELEEVIDRADRRLDEDAGDFDGRFFKGAALGFRGRHRSNRRQWFRAARDGKRAMDYVLGVAEENPKVADYQFGKGIYDYYAAMVPERYPWAKPLMVFFPSGSRERGIRLLSQTAREGAFLQTEAVYFLLQIQYLYERDIRRSIELVDWLRNEHPRNSFFHTFEGRVRARAGQWTRVEQIFSEVLERYRSGWSGYNDAVAQQAYYYIARSRLVRDEYRDALAALHQIERLAQGQRYGYFKTWGRLRQGMAYDALGRRDLAIDRYRQVLRMPDRAGSHERAERYLQRPYRG